MIVHRTKESSLSLATRGPSWRTTAIFAASLALLVQAAVAFGSSYLSRLDQHVQEADKCNRVAASLINTTTFARDAVKAAASTLAESKPFILPPIDDILHSQDQDLNIIDPRASDIIHQLEGVLQDCQG
jgi:hypothetical protein